MLSGLGLGAVLMLLPLALLGGSVALLLNGGLLAALWLKGSERIFRYSIDRPATELLYLPLPASLKLEVKAFIDVAMWRLGRRARRPHDPACWRRWAARDPPRMSIINLVCLGAWIGSAAVAQRLYVVQLGESLRRHRLDLERTLDLRARPRHAPDARGPAAIERQQDVVYALGVLGLAEHQEAPPRCASCFTTSRRRCGSARSRS